MNPTSSELKVWFVYCVSLPKEQKEEISTSQNLECHHN